MKRLAIVFGVLMGSLVGALVVREVVAEDEDPVVIVHWSNPHLTREELLPAMADKFNDEDHETASGRPIEIEVVKCDSAFQAGDLVSRVKGSGHSDEPCEDDGAPAPAPTIVTPQSSDWLVDVNYEAGLEVVDMAASRHIAETWLGIVTYREMARCLGWPDQPIGYSDLVTLAADPDGWQSHGCAEPSWGREPLLAFTNPSRSTSGRNVLVSLYSMAAGKAPADLTLADVENPAVVDFVQDFQGLVDHYMPNTIALNTKIDQGEEAGQFFLMPEDNLVSLLEGNETAIADDGTEQPIDEPPDLVMIYPTEGAVLNANPAAVVNARWVTEEQQEGAQEWIDFLLDEPRQEAFMEHGFRPPEETGLTPDEAQFEEWGLDAATPAATIEPGDLEPEVLQRIIDSWSVVRNPAIVTFVVDTSGSMTGTPLEQVKDGLERVLDSMARSDSPENATKVGLVTFSDQVTTAFPPTALADAKFELAESIDNMSADGGTALYDAIARAVEITDQAAGDERSKRSIVVLSDGAATDGTCLDLLVEMISRTDEADVELCGMGDQPIDENGMAVDLEDVLGDGLAVDTDNPVQIFFLGFGDAEVNIGRILAQATDAEYQDSPDDELAAVIEGINGYF